MVGSLKKRRDRRVRDTEECRRLLGEDCQDGGQISKVPVGNPAGEGSVFLPFSSVIAEWILCPTVGEASSLFCLNPMFLQLFFHDATLSTERA